MSEISGTEVFDVPSVRFTVPLADADQVFITQVVSVGAWGFGISSGVPNRQPVAVQSKFEPAVKTGPSAQAPVASQLKLNRLVDPSGVGPSGTIEAPPPMLSPPQVRVFRTVFEMSFTSPHWPPAGRRVKSRCGSSSVNV